MTQSTYGSDTQSDQSAIDHHALISALQGSTLPSDSPSPTEIATILVVDDELITRTLLSHQLQMAGYKIETAEDGSQAVSYTHLTLPTKA